MPEIKYQELEPDHALSDFVKRFWKMSNPTNEKLNYTILPDGYFDLVIMFREGNLESISLFGLWTKEIEVVVPAQTTILSICFKPLATEYLLQKTISKILNGNEKLPNHFWNIDKISICDLDKWKEEISEEMFLILRKNKPVDERKKTIFNLLFQSNGSLSVQELSDKLFWNTRQINRYFKSQFGLSPKTYCNILRCFASYTDIRAGDFYPNQNFYDQSHFIKEIKKHTGLNPTELHQNKNDRFLQFKTLS